MQFKANGDFNIFHLANLSSLHVLFFWSQGNQQRNLGKGVFQFFSLLFASTTATLRCEDRSLNPEEIQEICCNANLN